VHCRPCGFRVPNMTPIFMRIWLMKMRMVLLFERVPASFLSACS